MWSEGVFTKYCKIFYFTSSIMNISCFQKLQTKGEKVGKYTLKAYTRTNAILSYLFQSNWHLPWLQETNLFSWDDHPKCWTQLTQMWKVHSKKCEKIRNWQEPSISFFSLSFKCHDIVIWTHNHQNHIIDFTIFWLLMTQSYLPFPSPFITRIWLWLCTD